MKIYIIVTANIRKSAITEGFGAVDFKTFFSNAISLLLNFRLDTWKKCQTSLSQQRCYPKFLHYIWCCVMYTCCNTKTCEGNQPRNVPYNMYKRCTDFVTHNCLLFLISVVLTLCLLLSGSRFEIRSKQKIWWSKDSYF